MTIPFTQYLRPNGAKKAGGFDRPPEVEAVAHELIALGVHFDAEILVTGHLSLTAEHDDLDDPVLAIAVFMQESPDNVGRRVDQLVNDARLMWAVRTEAV